MNQKNKVVTVSFHTVWGTDCSHKNRHLFRLETVSQLLQPDGRILVSTTATSGLASGLLSTCNSHSPYGSVLNK